MSSKALMNVLTTPQSVAKMFDWKKVSGCVLSLDVHADRIGLALASHPAFQEPLAHLQPVELKRRSKVTPEAKQRIRDLVKEHKVCGVVVNWPLQQDTGRMGASCGRVLHTLEDILQEDATMNRPLCLWNGSTAMDEVESEDSWGRCAAFSRTSSKTSISASQERYNEDEKMVAAQVWDDFCKTHWPQLYQTSSTNTKEETTTNNIPCDLEYLEDTATYVKATA